MAVWDRHVHVLFLVAQSSDQTQPIDLMTFAPLKQRFARSKFGRLSTAQSNGTVRILGTWLAASARDHNIEAFMSTRLIPFERSGRFYLRVEREQAQRVRAPPVPRREIPPAPLRPESLRRLRLPTAPE
jgi:hypothetical protein